MGGCFSGLYNHDDCDYDCDSSLSSARTAKVITFGGELSKYGIPVTASQVLQSGSSSVSSSASARFVCDSDRLYYEEFIQALDPEAELVGGQIYFELPKSRLQQRLTASDMAALAVKASLAMQKAEEQGGRGRTRTRISPTLQVKREEFGFISEDANQTKVARTGDEFPFNEKMRMVSGRSESLRKLRKYPSRRLRRAVQSFRIRLGTIHEGAADEDF